MRFNPHVVLLDLRFTIPVFPEITEAWQVVVDTSDDDSDEVCLPGMATTLIARSTKFLRAPSRVVRTGGAEHSLGATYRLQLAPNFGFAEASQVIDYLIDLGTDVYCSPILTAGRGSTHGYDVVDHRHISAALGGRAGFEACVRNSSA